MWDANFAILFLIIRHLQNVVLSFYQNIIWKWHFVDICGKQIKLCISELEAFIKISWADIACMASLVFCSFLMFRFKQTDRYITAVLPFNVLIFGYSNQFCVFSIFSFTLIIPFVVYVSASIHVIGMHLLWKTRDTFMSNSLIHSIPFI